MNATPNNRQPTEERSLLMLSPIPVWQENGRWHTLDLWARDLNEQAQLFSITILCPIKGSHQNNKAELNEFINIVDSSNSISEDFLYKLIYSSNFIQFPANSGWKNSRNIRNTLKISKKLKKITILGISSNRARTVLLNNKEKGLLKRVKSLFHYIDLRLFQQYLARQVSGVFIVGAGLLPFIKRHNKNIHVGIASWIRESDIRSPQPRQSSPLRICMAGRLERMKGFHIGIDAISTVRSEIEIKADIIGDGPELSNLQKQVSASKLDDIVNFAGTVSYPDAFLEFIGEHDIALLTNLNDEQPRLIFDAISRGCIPICPDNPAYLNLGLDPRILYRQGDHLDLAKKIVAISAPGLQSELRIELQRLARHFTLGAMHRRRLEWMQQLSPRS